MLSICTQTAISVLHDIALGSALQSVNYLLSAEEWKDLFDKLEKAILSGVCRTKSRGISLRMPYGILCRKSPCWMCSRH